MEGYKPQDFSFFHRSEKLVQLVIELSQTDKAVLQEMGANGRAYYDEHFTKEKSLRKLEDIMELN